MQTNLFCWGYSTRHGNYNLKISSSKMIGIHIYTQMSIAVNHRTCLYLATLMFVRCHCNYKSVILISNNKKKTCLHLPILFFFIDAFRMLENSKPCTVTSCLVKNCVVIDPNFVFQYYGDDKP